MAVKLCKDRPFADRVAGRIGYHLSGASDGSRAVSTARVLLIDDDVDLLELLNLEREEFVATAIDVAASGVAAALSGDHDLVVLDVVMPNMSGMKRCGKSA
jgi:CheY-like chemotaxis protein